jgi:hypothetical protein
LYDTLKSSERFGPPPGVVEPIDKLPPHYATLASGRAADRPALQTAVGQFRGLRGGSWLDFNTSRLQSGGRADNYPVDEQSDFGFRVATVPEPSMFVLGALGILGFMARRARRLFASASLAEATTLGHR